MKFEKYLAKEFKKVRKQRKMTYGQVAKAAGLSLVCVWLVENGQRKPEYETLEKLAKGLGMGSVKQVIWSSWVGGKDDDK